MNIDTSIIWTRSPGETFVDGKYNRVHKWIFDGGVEMKASPSPEIVPIPMSDPSLVDPEEAFVASISSCHMLFFLSFASKKKIVIESYEDQAKGTMGKNEKGKTVVLNIDLHPKVVYGGHQQPSEEAIRKLHDMAHRHCFLANSVLTKISIIL